MKKKITVFIMITFVLLMSGCDKEVVIDETIDILAYVEGAPVYTLENDQFLFTLDPETTTFTVTDKTNGYQWFSNPPNGATDPLADPLSIKYLQSTFMLEYAADNGIYSTYSNYDLSIAKKTYSIEQNADSIDVTYIVGDTKKEYRFPTAVPDSRMQVYLERMDKSQKRQVENYFRKYDIDNLRANDDKSTLLETYPDLANEPVYALREGLQEYIKEKLETVFAESGYNDEEFAYDQMLYENESASEIPIFRVTMSYSLDDSGLNVTLPFEKMAWKDAYPMTKIHVLPFLGAGDTSAEGYMVVPEGTGAIIDFNNNKNEQTAYYCDVYGWDEGLKREELVTDNKTAFPVFGIGRDAASMICVLEDGAALASIKADVSGRNHSYNYVYATYITLHSDAMEVAAKTDRSVMVYEAKKPEGSIHQKYVFLDTTDYSAMATEYGNYLTQRYPNLNGTCEGEAPLNITLLGAADNVRQVLGFPKLLPLALTDFQEAKTVVQDLENRGLSNAQIRYFGWMNGGINQQYDNRFKTVSALGSKNEFKDFIAFCKEKDVDLYLDGFFQYAFNPSWGDDLKPSRDVSKYASRELVELKELSFVHFGIKPMSESYYLLKPQQSLTYLENMVDKVVAYGGNGIALKDIGMQLSGDYNPKAVVTREEVADLQANKLASIAASGMKIAVSSGNTYVLDAVSLITDMDLTGERFNIIDDTIPFYTMALHGKIPYSGTALNDSADFEIQLLKSVENGAGLNFTLMKAPASELQETNYTKYYGADYDRWIEKIEMTYKRYNGALGHTFSLKMSQHEKVSDNVYRVTYEDGTQVYVNYSHEAYTIGPVIVPAMDFTVVEVMNK